MYPPAQPIQPPRSYADLNLPDIKITNVPESAPGVTPVQILSLYRPQNHNAFTQRMQESITEFYTLVNSDDRVKVVVLTGHGKMFCVGADLEMGFGGGASKSGETTTEVPERDLDHRDRGGRVSLAIQQCSKPTIAAIQGSAVGIGITMCLPATIRVACAQAKIGFVFGRRGIIMEACSHFYLPKLIGLSRAMHVTATGSVYPASHPLLQDLFSEVLPTPQATLERALELANDIAQNVSTVSSKLMRDLLVYGSATPEEAHLMDSRLVHSLYGGGDNIEGVKSFFEKRPPRFTGSPQRDMPPTWPWWRQVDIGYVQKWSKDRVSNL